ncbi:MAG: hypothetical protein ACLQVX_22550 [Limisphaerales bacterium]
MAARAVAKVSLPAQWNDPQLDGVINTGEYGSDFGSVIPGVLHLLDLPDLGRFIAPRKLLFCAPSDLRSTGIEQLSARFKALTTPGRDEWLRYEPGQALDSKVLLDWLNPKADQVHH